MSADCVFCKIRDGELPSMRVYEDERTLAIMDINPLNAGHLQAAITTAKKVATGLRAAVKPDGLNVLQANGAAAFQSVPHLHLHLIPRWNNDGKGFDWPLVAGDRAQIQAVGVRLREAIG
jgi:histidine triad (HIT) family protein